MMLVQKHTLILPMSPTLTHRRNPSASPAVIVQPTRTPGLLSLSKPPRPSPPHQRQIHAQQRQHNKALSKPRQQPIASILAQPAADNSISGKPLPLPAAATTTNPPQSRSRAHAKHPKEKPNNPPRTLIRSSSHNSLSGRPSRQPSPPIPPQSKTSQAEGPINRPVQSSNLFDPFLDDAMLIKSQPTLNIKPSGKLARRRQTQAGTVAVAGAAPPSPTPVSSKAIPVPSSNNRTRKHNFSRSDPALSHMPSKLPRRHSSTAGFKFDVFPICDDMTDAGDASDHEQSAPTTPTRPKAQNRYPRSPHTAPLTGTFPVLPPAPASAPQNKTRQGGRKHKRSPSEGMFNMSSDEDSSFGLNPNVAALFQLARTPGTAKKSPGHVYASPYKTPLPSAPKFAQDAVPAAVQARERQFEKEAAEKVAGYFASSSFQNSPNPEELPDPLFM